MRIVLATSLALVVATGPALADPAPTPVAPAPAFGIPQMSLFDKPTPPVVPSLRLEAARVAAEQFEQSWRYPEPGPMVTLDGESWFVGAGLYRPRTARSAALHGGSIGATLLGEVLLGSGSPLAGIGALAVGATLDAAAADADTTAEAARR